MKVMKNFIHLVRMPKNFLTNQRGIIVGSSHSNIFRNKFMQRPIAGIKPTQLSCDLRVDRRFWSVR